jgi:hypothetical protein
MAWKIHASSFSSLILEWHSNFEVENDDEGEAADLAGRMR